MLQCVVVYCSALQIIFAIKESTNVLQCVAVFCSVLYCAAVCCNVLQCVAVCCSVLQCAITCFADDYVQKLPILEICKMT